MTCNEELRMEVEDDLREKLEHHQIGEGGHWRGIGGADENERERREMEWEEEKIEEKGGRSRSSVYFPKFPPGKDIQV